MQKTSVNIAIIAVCVLIVSLLFSLPNTKQQLAFGGPQQTNMKYASTTQTSAVSFCLTGDSCITSWTAGTADGTFSTTSAMWFVHSSTTIPKTYTANTFSLLNTFTNATSTLLTATTAWVGTLNLTNDLTVANGGTGVSTFGGTNHVLYTSTADNLASEAALTYLASGDLLTLVNASTTNLTATNSLFVESVRQSKYQYVAFTYSTTTWAGTTTVQRTIAPFDGTLQDIQCDLTAGTVNTHLYVNSTPVMPMLSASTTAGTVTFSSANTFAKGDTLELRQGTPASTPTDSRCTARVTVTTP